MRAVFLAAPDRGAGALGLVDKLILEMQVLTGGALKGSDWFAPHLQVGDVGVETDAATRFTASLEALQRARVVVAVLDGAQVDDEVAFLVGYAFAAGKPIVGFASDGRAHASAVEAACREIVADARGLSQALARALA